MTTVHCIIEADRGTGSYVGRLVGFPHFEMMGATADDVEAKLRRHILSIHESGDLLLESEFVRAFRIELP